MKILIIEDDVELRDLTKRFLERRNYIVDEADDGTAGLELMRINDYDCLILDLNLPEIDGLKVAEIVRKEISSVPIIMLTARSQLYDKLEGFKTGADDYITKPFEMQELLVRIEAIIRRNSQNKEVVLNFDSMQFYPSRNKIMKANSEAINLSTKETALLEYLVRKKGSIVSAEELLEHVWDREIDVFSETVKTHIKTLRKKVDPDKRYIKTIRGKGYLYEGI